MPYKIKHLEADVNVGVDGWSLILPFRFGNEGQLVGDFSRLLFAAHLALPHADKASFQIASKDALRTVGSVSVVAEKPENPTLDLQNVKLTKIVSQQSVREAESIWTFRGTAKTGVVFNPPQQGFPDWGHDGPDIFGWSGTLDDTTNAPLALLAYAQVEWDQRQHFSSAQFAGPSGITGAKSIFNKLKDDFALKVAGQLTMNDRRRPRRNAVFFGNDALGRAQVHGAQGAIWIGHGSFLLLSAEKWRHLTLHSHDNSIDLSALLGQQPLARTMVLEDEGPATAATEASGAFDVVFEGLSVWNLQPRRVPAAQNAAGPPPEPEPGVPPALL